MNIFFLNILMTALYLKGPVADTDTQDQAVSTKGIYFPRGTEGRDKGQTQEVEEGKKRGTRERGRDICPEGQRAVSRERGDGWFPTQQLRATSNPSSRASGALPATHMFCSHRRAGMWRARVKA